ncbi:MAG: nucleoside monophosphate kinase [Candidatus Paceibacterota bacterium]|jgi:adenylate kinase family enzyme
MTPQTFIFIGRSGCGKGTQVGLLSEALKKLDSEREIFHLETGAMFREFIKEENYTSTLSLGVYKTGGLQPAFLAVHIWSHVLIEKFKGIEHLFMDGICRTLPEVLVLDTALRFYNRESATVILLNVSKNWSLDRLHTRAKIEGRIDDIKNEDIEKRLSWFDTDVVPAIDHMKHSPLYQVLEINGEQTIEEVHAEILSKLSL